MLYLYKYNHIVVYALRLGEFKMKTIRKWFLAGLAVVLPLGVTVFVLIWMFNLLDGILDAPVFWIFGQDIPGVGLLAIIVIILVIGMLTSNYIGKKMTVWFHALVMKIPIVGNVYKPVSKIANSLSSETSKSFQSVVTVEFPSKGIFSLAFITNDNVAFGGDDKVCIFIPTTPNPTNGFLVFVEKEQITELDISVAEGLNMVVSIGSVIPHNVPFKRNREKGIGDRETL